MAAHNLFVRWNCSTLNPLMAESLGLELDTWTSAGGVPTREANQSAHDAAWHLMGWFDKAQDAINRDVSLEDLTESAKLRFLPWYRKRHDACYYNAACRAVRNLLDMYEGILLGD